MRIVVAPTARDAAREAAAHIGALLNDAIGERGQASLALSGGKSPVPMLEALAQEAVDWPKVHLFQVDERIVAPGDDARNLVMIERALFARLPGKGPVRHPMPVDALDVEAAARSHAADLQKATRGTGVLDVVQLGLGTDGHTASLFPGDPALTATALVAVTGPQAGYRRMTLTLPAINAAGHIVWFVTGADKKDALARLGQPGWSTPAGAVALAQAVLYADGPAGGA